VLIRSMIQRGPVFTQGCGALAQESKPSAER
jgi:hypothetical protein